MTQDFNIFFEIIEDLTSSIDAIRRIWEDLRLLNPGFEQLSQEHWRSREANFWIHGATDTLEAAELEQWLFYSVPVTRIETSPAQEYYNAWAVYMLDGEGIYADFTEDDLQPPKGKESLGDYVNRLARLVEEKGWQRKKRYRALKSFIDYLRDHYSEATVAFIETIFPKQMELHEKTIIRKIRPQVYPISQEIAADIVKALARQCAYGRANAQHNAAEALALVWLCLTASRIRLPRTLASVYLMSHEALLQAGEYPLLSVPSEFGYQQVRISNRVAGFLQAIANIPSQRSRRTILQKSLPDLRKVLRTAISKVPLPSEIGEITYLTFLSATHQAGENIR